MNKLQCSSLDGMARIEMPDIQTYRQSKLLIPETKGFTVIEATCKQNDQDVLSEHLCGRLSYSRVSRTSKFNLCLAILLNITPAL